MTATSSANVRFALDFFNKKIIGTKASFAKASKGFGPEYEELAAKMAAHPDFQLVVKEQKVKATKVKETYEGLNFDFMEAYFETLTNGAAVKKEYDAVKKAAKDYGVKVYPMTKKWFLSKFGTEEKPFDMEEAREAITAYRIQKATASVALSLVSSEVSAEQDVEDVA